MSSKAEFLLKKLAWGGEDKSANVFADEKGWVDVGQWPRITEWLLNNGYAEGDVQKIIGLNFLRVFREVWGE